MLSFLFFANILVAQDSVANKQLVYFQYLHDSTTNRIDYGCGWVGMDSENLFLIRNLIAAKRFDLITNLLESGTPATRYLAAVSLLYADKKSHYRMDSLTLSKVDILKQDKNTIPFCSGCTGHWTYSIKTLLDRKSKVPMARWTHDWISDSFNQ